MAKFSVINELQRLQLYPSHFQKRCSLAGIGTPHAAVAKSVEEAFARFLITFRSFEVDLSNFRRLFWLVAAPLRCLQKIVLKPL